MIKAFAIVLIITATIVAGVMGYKAREGGTSQSAPTVRYGFIPFPGTLPYLVAVDKGFFREEGVDVQIVDETDYLEMNEKVANGSLDFQSQYVLIDVVAAVSKGKDLKVVMATDFSNGADAIVSRNDIISVSDLKGKKVAVNKGTLSEYLLSDALRKNNMETSDIIEVDLSSYDAAQAFIRGEVDAEVSWEPDVTQAVQEGSGKRLYTSRDSPGLIIDTLVFNGDYVTNHPDRVQSVIRGYFKALDFIDRNPEEAYAIGAKYSNTTLKEFQEQMSSVKLLDLNANRDLMYYKTSIDSLHGAFNDAQDFLLQGGFLGTPVESIQVIDPEFIRNIK